MKVIDTDILDLKIIEPKVFGDDRGFFFESWNSKLFNQNVLSVNFLQDNHSKSNKGVIRGLHFQTENTQAKLVRVVRGAVFDVAVDLRTNSATFGRWYGVVLSAENKKQLFIPKGFAHGFLTLEDGTEFLYKCDDVYNSQAELTIAWDCPEIGIKWPLVSSNVIISEKDKNGISLSEFVEL